MPVSCAPLSSRGDATRGSVLRHRSDGQGDRNCGRETEGEARRGRGVVGVQVKAAAPYLRSSSSFRRETGAAGGQRMLSAQTPCTKPSSEECSNIGAALGSPAL
ncbi:hypothetical protein AAFF_G00201100 [Aldrovandia affinis]|uniref:Uncharacterized protein n=1 Tax=Aldrovandia affinis TaxID=143900 RepID=A0AAD7RIK7_9TELE|nr:hypothetical protein AAFF_G00201100 [Aldrovandia affinis]